MSVNLAKGQRVSLQKGSGGTLTVVRMGLGWQAAPKRGLFGSRTRKIDLDASALLYAERTPSDVVFFQHLESTDGSVRHTGDNLEGGSGADDDEAILVDLLHVPAHITQVVFTVSSYTGQTFAEVRNAHCRLVDETTGVELARYELAGGGPHTGQIMAKVFRDGNGGWEMQAIGAPAKGRTFQDLLPAIEPFL
ncbi:TerD family protein [Kitasatospora aureofaciens]|uniref:TerD family protein n=1 Tax=Kitasatospora aureofaciens TaxID=1894 RepID=UPI001C46517A|nr:TerD family protein [Kitasatospora aureofaciens]MBV6697542.1 TerD family protein [Kitasatospora aureofaciens]